jgi:peptidyl-tRNA hydrolase, PTH1 family
MKIIAFLGNPGNKYMKNRHNTGYICGFHFAEFSGIRINQKHFSSITGKGRIDGMDTLLLLPGTFMNNSGLAVRDALGYYDENAENLIVVHDEVELPFCEINVKFSGGHKGHNGIRSIIDNIGSPDFYRFRVGVGRPDNPHISVADYLLSDFSPEELLEIEAKLPDITEKLVSLLSGKPGENV